MPMIIKVLPNKSSFMSVISDNNIKQIALLSTDFSGRRKRLTLTVDRFLAGSIWRNIESADGSNYGVKSSHSSDMGLLPDLDTAFIDPFSSPLPTLSFICSIREANGQAASLDPRGILERAQKYLASLVKGNLLCAPELEFYLKEPDPIKQKEISRLLDPLPTYYHADTPHDLYYSLRSDMANKMVELRIPVKYHHPEVGGTNDGTMQQEIELSFASPLQTADYYTLARHIIENSATLNKLKAQFSPKPFKDLAGNGLHTHLYLSKNGKSLFYPKKNKYGLNALAFSFIGGVLRHGQAIAAFTNPTRESYKRLDPEHEAPVDLRFGLADRTAAIRIPAYALNPKEARFEYRPTDASGNYYLALAAIIMAGADGIKNKIDPVKNYGHDSKGKREKLPTSVKKAARALEKDHKFLLQGNVFVQEAIDLQRKNISAQPKSERKE